MIVHNTSGVPSVSELVDSDTCPRPTTGSFAWMDFIRAGRVKGSVALSRCTTTHPLYARFTHILGASVSKTTMRPNPRRVRKDLASKPLTELRQRARKINPDDVRKMFLNTAYAGQTIDTILEEARAGPPARGMPSPPIQRTIMLMIVRTFIQRTFRAHALRRLH